MEISLHISQLAGFSGTQQSPYGTVLSPYSLLIQGWAFQALVAWVSPSPGVPLIKRKLNAKKVTPTLQPRAVLSIARRINSPRQYQAPIKMRGLPSSRPFFVSYHASSCLSSHQEIFPTPSIFHPISLHKGKP